MTRSSRNTQPPRNSREDLETRIEIAQKRINHARELYNARSHSSPPKNGHLDLDFDVVGKVIEGLTEVRSLVLSFMGQVEIPAELVCYDSCKDIDNLVLASPLSFSSSTTLKPTFKKVPTFAPIDQYPSKINRSWSSTFSFLASHKITSTQLDLTHFPLYSQYLMPHLYPFAWSLIELHLPRLELGGLFAFAQGCINLEKLSIKTIDISSIPALCQLLVFPPTLKAIHVDHLEGSNVGYFSLSKEQEDKDTISHFLNTLEKMSSTMEIKVLQIGTIKQVMGEHRRRLEKLEEKGLEVEVYHVDNARSEEETQEFIKVLQDSLQASVKSATSETQSPPSPPVDIAHINGDSQDTQKGADLTGLDEKVKTNGNEVETKSEPNGNAINGEGTKEKK
ncbi:hypothetical protein JCM5353_007522 [Sporobolomyces roseus]